MKTPALKPEDVERRLIWALILQPDTFDDALAALDVEDFSENPARQLFQALGILRERGYSAWNAADLQPFIAQGVFSWLGDEVSALPEQTEPLIEAVREHSLRRSTYLSLADAGRRIKNLDISPVEVLSDAQHALSTIQSRAVKVEPSGMFALAKQAVESARAARRGDVRLTSWGPALPCLDRELGGLFRGRMYVVGGQSGTGKTAFAYEVALRGAERALVLSCEMSAEDSCRRLICQEAGLSQVNVETGRLSAAELHQFETAAARVAQSHLEFQSVKGKTAKELVAMVRHLLQHRDYDLVLLDYMQRVKPARAAYGIYEHMSEVADTIANALDEHMPPWMLLTQFNQDAKQRKDPTPVPGDVLGGKELFHKTDYFIALHRPYLYRHTHKSPGAEDPDVLRVMVQKNRHGRHFPDYLVKVDPTTFRFMPVDSNVSVGEFARGQAS